jgi:hypothetical protein
MRRFFAGLVLAAVAATCLSPAHADDKQTAQYIADSLKAGNLKGYNIDVRYQAGIARLTGTVSSPQQRATALAIAQQTPGVTNVVDELSVLSAGSPAGRGIAARPVAAGAMQGAPGMPRPLVAAGGPQAAMAGYGHPGGPFAHAPSGMPIPVHPAGIGGGVARAGYDQPHMPNYAWPAYAAYPNYGAVTYPKQYSPTAWPFIGPFYPYPQVPLGWRKVTLEWDDGWWMLDFKARRH